MKCPRCDNPSIVKDTGYTQLYTGAQRRRECQVCRTRFTTVEVLLDNSVHDHFIGLEHLTMGERELLAEFLQGITDHQLLAAKLYVSVTVVSLRQRALLRKSGAENVVQLVLKYQHLRRNAA